MTMHWVGIDIGGTNTRGVLVDLHGTIVSRFKYPTKANNPASYLATLVSAVRTLVGERSLGGIGLGVPGLVRYDGLLVKTVNIPLLAGTSLTKALAEHFSVPVVQGNDATMAALGEQWLGAGRDVSSMLMLTIGTGLGSGLIVDGEPFCGAHGYAVELGHLPVVPDGIACPCGHHGCLEQYVSAAAVARYAGTLDAAAAAQGALVGQQACLKAFETLGSWLGLGLCAAMNLLDPALVVIGGGVAESFELFAPAARKKLVQCSFNPCAEDVPIVKAQRGDDAGSLGAARYSMLRSGVK